jgi:ABC-type multidrug transport system fused ATPase/permease subunit
MKTIIHLFKELFSRFPGHFVLLFVLVFMQAFMNALSVVAVAPITDFLLERVGNNASQITKSLAQLLGSVDVELTLLTVFLFFGGLMIVNGLIGVAAQFAQLRIKYDVLIHLLTDTMGQFFRARFLFFSQGEMGKLLNSFQQEVNKVGDTFGHIAQLIANLLQALIFMVVPFTLSPKLSFIFLFVALVLMAPLLLLRGYTYRLGQRNTETSNVSAGILHETLTAAKLILGFGRQVNAVGRYRDALVKHSEVSVKFQTLQRGVSLISSPLSMIAALVALYVAYLDGIPFGDMAMVMFAFMRLMPIAGLLMHGKTSIEGFTPAYEQLEDLRRQAAVLEEPQGGIKFQGLKEELRFDNVSFSYPGRKLSLDGISDLSIKKNKMTALVGKSGAGKTTLIDLILGFYEQSAGQILLDGKDLANYDLNSFRRKVGYVPQDPQLFNTTVKENMLWSLPEVSEKDIWYACRLANAEQFVRELPEELDTILGDRGVRLSGGQRQRLAMARAIIRKPDLLILDEATSSLDTDSERLIQKSIDSLSGKMTIIVIAHRLSTIRNADYVYVIDEGRVIEEGSFKVLSSNPKSNLSKMIVEQTN